MPIEWLINEKNTAKFRKLIIITFLLFVFCNKLESLFLLNLFIFTFCDYDDYKDEYIKLDTEQYRKDRNLEFYWDPYKSLNVFIREK